MNRLSLLTSLLAAVLLAISSIPAVAGNLMPNLCLEIWGFEEDPGDTVPSDVCTHTDPVYPDGLPCTAPKSPYGFGLLAVYVGKLDMPICPTLGEACVGYGGYAGLCFGIVQRGQPALFLGFEACPGFMVGYSDGPEDIIVHATTSCHDWHDHPGFLKYVNLSTSTNPTYFGIVESASQGHHKIINCELDFDHETSVDGCAAWGGTQYGGYDCMIHAAEYLCLFTPVEPTTWGSIKAIFR